jgi:hypothetical protein
LTIHTRIFPRTVVNKVGTMHAPKHEIMGGFDEGAALGREQSCCHGQGSICCWVPR